MADPKELAALIVAKKGAPESPTESQTESGDSIMEGAAEEVMQAMQANDPKSFCEALKSFIQICMP